MTAYYNENDPYAAQWLRNLIATGHIAAGDVDERSIVDVRPADLEGYKQCHFFAGIVGWSLALRMAGWPDDRPVWTGSCPCQPFSQAGKRKGFADERHLWPVWFSLIRECRPAVILGEQVEAAIGWGWIDLVFADLEAESYACASTVLPACGVGAPHIRQRLWFVADADAPRRGEFRRGRLLGRLLDGERSAQRNDTDRCAESELADAERDGGRPDEPRRTAPGRAAAGRSPWREVEWLVCTDGKARPVEPGLEPLAHGVPARVAKLRALGNAIVPQCAAEFIRAAIDSLAEPEQR